MIPLIRMSRYDTISINRRSGYLYGSRSRLQWACTHNSPGALLFRDPVGKAKEGLIPVLDEAWRQGARKQQSDSARRRELERARERSRIRFAAAWATAIRQEELARKREQTRKRKLAEEAAAWKHFVQTEQRQLQLRKNGQLAKLLGKPLPGEFPAMLQRLVSEDERQAERGLVALMSGGKTFYKDIHDLAPEDMPARIAANRLRTTWLKERRDGWLGRGEVRP
jgi:hypothetical protein